MSTATAFSLASRLKAGETVYSGWCGLPAPIVAELVRRMRGLMAQAGAQAAGAARTTSSMPAHGN